MSSVFRHYRNEVIKQDVNMFGEDVNFLYSQHYIYEKECAIDNIEINYEKLTRLRKSSKELILKDMNIYSSAAILTKIPNDLINDNDIIKKSIDKITDLSYGKSVMDLARYMQNDDTPHLIDYYLKYLSKDILKNGITDNNCEKYGKLVSKFPLLILSEDSLNNLYLNGRIEVQKNFMIITDELVENKKFIDTVIKNQEFKNYKIPLTDEVKQDKLFLEDNIKYLLENNKFSPYLPVLTTSYLKLLDLSKDEDISKINNIISQKKDLYLYIKDDINNDTVKKIVEVNPKVLEYITDKMIRDNEVLKIVLDSVKDNQNNYKYVDDLTKNMYLPRCSQMEMQLNREIIGADIFVTHLESAINNISDSYIDIYEDKFQEVNEDNYSQSYR